MQIENCKLLGQVRSAGVDGQICNLQFAIFTLQFQTKIQMTTSSETPINESSTSTPAPLNLAKVLQQMLEVSDKVSDLIFSPGRPPQVELVGKLQPVQIAGIEKLSPAQTFGIAKLMIADNASATESLDKFGSADLSFSLPGLNRFRVNIFKQRGTHAIVMRVIPTRPPRFEDFNLPKQLREIVELKNGVVLVTGPTGSGKSSTLAAIIDLINVRIQPFINANCIRTRRTLRWLCAPRCDRRRR